MVLGIRGMPNVQGGVETHAEQLYPRLVSLGCEVVAIVRSPFVPAEARSFGGVQLKRLWAPRRQGVEALLHSLLGVLYAGFVRPDILHVHAVGPMIVVPIARLFGLTVVVTHHGPDYDRDKWRPFARGVLRLGERWGVRYSQARIAISRVIADLIRAKYGMSSDLVPNGVVVAASVPGMEHLQSFSLQSGRYILQVSRIVPEKRQSDLIAAFLKARPPGWKLVLVGGIDESQYCRQVADSARGCADIVLTGFQKGAPLEQLYANAGAFVLPSTHEGLPIALLEALAHGLSVGASDIPANLEVGLDEQSYFPVGNVDALAALLTRLTGTALDDAARAARMRWVTDKYDWDRIAGQTLAVYRSALRGGNPLGR
ncbi:MAG: glycosyltransferase family 4 protein [Pseudomonadota bacterium]